MDYETIEAAALALGKEDRIDLLEAITDSLRADIEHARDPRPIVAQVEAAAGRDLPARGRFPGVVAMRAVIAYRLRNEQHLTFGEIGDAINRDHSTVGFYLDRMDCVLKHPAMWPEYYGLYNKSKTL